MNVSGLNNNFYNSDNGCDVQTNGISGKNNKTDTSVQQKNASGLKNEKSQSEQKVTAQIIIPQITYKDSSKKINDKVKSSIKHPNINYPDKITEKTLLAEKIQDEMWEDTPYMDVAFRYPLYRDTGAHELIDDAPYEIKSQEISENDKLNFNYNNLKKIGIQNLTISTNKKGVRGSSIFSKTNRKHLPLLKENGINSVIDLRAESNVERCIGQCAYNGLKYIPFPIDYDQKLTLEQINSIKNLMPDFINAMNDGNYYIGCNEGTNRTDVAFGLNYLFNPKEKTIPEFKSKSPQKSLQMTKRITNTLLTQNADGQYVYLDNEFVKKLGWKNLDEFISEYTLKAKNLSLYNINK